MGNSFRDRGGRYLDRDERNSAPADNNSNETTPESSEPHSAESSVAVGQETPCAAEEIKYIIAGDTRIPLDQYGYVDKSVLITDRQILECLSKPRQLWYRGLVRLELTKAEASRYTLGSELLADKAALRQLRYALNPEFHLRRPFSIPCTSLCKTLEALQGFSVSDDEDLVCCVRDWLRYSNGSYSAGLVEWPEPLALGSPPDSGDQHCNASPKSLLISLLGGLLSYSTLDVKITSSSTVFEWLHRAAKGLSCYGPEMSHLAAAAYAWRSLCALSGTPHPNEGLEAVSRHATARVVLPLKMLCQITLHDSQPSLSSVDVPLAYTVALAYMETCLWFIHFHGCVSLGLACLRADRKSIVGLLAQDED